MAEPSRGEATLRKRLWLPLLRDLSDEPSARVVFKGSVSSSMGGVGDVDAYAPPSAFPHIERRFRSWVAASDLQVVVVCRHDWRGPTMVAIRRDDPFPYTLDVKVGRLYHGSFLFTVDDLDELVETDADGVRRLVAGAAGTVRLLIDGTTRSGRRDDHAFEAKGIREALAADPDGALAAARFVGVAAPALRRGIEAILDGGWSRLDMAVVTAWCHARSLARPDRLAHQFGWRYVAGPACAVPRLDPRRGPPDVERWLSDVAGSHTVNGFLGVSEAT